jgi:peptidoglycan/LPS O-acetylase OafA/YrhL
VRAANSYPSGSLDRPSSSDRAYRPDIDGLRALAILSVVLCHANVPGITGGFTGVDIFFVISGYLIGGHIYAELRAGCFSYLSFYRRRAKRILPAYFAVLAFILLVALVLLSPLEAAQTARSAFAATLSASNVLFWATANYFAAKTELNPVLMTWSLGVEEQFYAVIPLLMVLLARIRRNWLLPAVLATCALSFVFAWSLLGRYPMMVFYTLPARAWELGAGVALAAAELNRKRRPLPRPGAPTQEPSHPSRKDKDAARVERPSHSTTRRGALAELASLGGLAMMLAPVFLLTPATPFPGPAALPSVLGTAMLIAVPASWINRRLLSLRPLVFIGKVSYSWYLWHWPLLALVRILYDGTPTVAASLLTVAAALAVAALSYYWIEQPFRRSTRPPIPLLVRYAAVSLVLLAAWATIWLGHGLPWRFPALAKMEAAGQTLKADPCLAGETDQPNLTLACYDASAALGGIVGRQPRRGPRSRPALGRKRARVRLCRAGEELLHAAHRRNPLHSAASAAGRGLLALQLYYARPPGGRSPHPSGDSCRRLGRAAVSNLDGWLAERRRGPRTPGSLAGGHAPALSGIAHHLDPRS